jgi:hypothetical protein
MGRNSFVDPVVILGRSTLQDVELIDGDCKCSNHNSGYQSDDNSFYHNGFFIVLATWDASFLRPQYKRACAMLLGASSELQVPDAF